MNVFAREEYSELFESIAAVKQRREQFEEQLKTGDVSLSEVFELALAEPVLSTMKVLPAIEALPETGKVSTRRAFGDLGIDEAGLIGDVTPDQVAALPEAIQRHTR